MAHFPRNFWSKGCNFHHYSKPFILKTEREYLSFGYLKTSSHNTFLINEVLHRQAVMESPKTQKTFAILSGLRNGSPISWDVLFVFGTSVPLNYIIKNCLGILLSLKLLVKYIRKIALALFIYRVFTYHSELAPSIQDDTFVLFLCKCFYSNVKKVISSPKKNPSLLLSNLTSSLDWCDNLVNEVKHLILEQENYKG